MVVVVLPLQKKYFGGKFLKNNQNWLYLMFLCGVTEPGANWEFTRLRLILAQTTLPSVQKLV